MFKRHTQPTLPEGASSGDDDGTTFLDGVFGERHPGRETDGTGKGGAADPAPRRPPAPVASARPAPASSAPVTPARRPEPPAPAPRTVSPVARTAVPTEDAAEQQPTPAVVPPPSAPARRPRTSRDPRRRGDLLLVLVTCLVIGLAAAVLTGAVGPLRHATTSTSTTPSTAPKAYRADPPAALPATGSYQRTSIGRKGAVTVTQWIRSDTPITAVEVTPESGTASTTARATDLVVAADHSRIKLPATVGPTGRRIALAEPAKLVYLRYHLTGVLDRGSSVPGRVLVRTTAMQLSYRHRTGPTVARVEAPKITSMACTDIALRGAAAGQPVSSPYVCGAPTRSPSGWKVKLTKKHRGASVSAQVELR